MTTTANKKRPYSNPIRTMTRGEVPADIASKGPAQLFATDGYGNPAIVVVQTADARHVWSRVTFRHPWKLTRKLAK